jgi:predicted enzyme related to lactoylglutathione lyase
MTTLMLRAALSLFATASMLSAFGGAHAQPTQDSQGGEAMIVQYLEIVTTDVDATCAALETLHGVNFGEPDAALGNARTAELKAGGLIGVRAPMHGGELPVARPYVLVEDIDAAVEAARASGAEIIVPPMDLPGHGKCSIYVLGGIQHGLWQR